ncbi:MAG: hypothetical protein HRT44_05460, partial [Bdellovibrionales bacterium]|nr:hypothetical protein [Bdellovibrionales bacterium]NQZ18690.1 hypothetical protein [Bdellovibrionales bacterium]
MKWLLLMVSFFCMISAAQARLGDVIDELNSQPYRIPPASTANGRSNQEVFSQYCTGRANDLRKSYPKYSQDLVKEAAIKLRQSQRDADAKLLEMYKAKWQQVLERVSENFERLNQSTQNPVVSNLSQQFLSSLDTEKEGFTSQQQTWFSTMLESVFSSLKTELDSLDSVVQEFKGVDYALLVQKLKDFRQQIDGKLKSVDLDQLSSLASAFRSEFSNYKNQLNVSTLLPALKVISAEFANFVDQESEFMWGKESVDNIISQLESGNSNPEELAFVLQDVLYFFTDEYFASYEFSPAAEQASKVVMLQSLSLNEEQNLVSIDDLLTKITEYKSGSGELYNVRYAAENLDRVLMTYVLVSKNPDFAQKANLFSIEVVAFSSSEFKSQLDDIIVSLEDTDSSNDLNAAASVQGLRYDVDRLKAILAGSIATFDEAYIEAIKSNQEEMISGLNDLKVMMNEFQATDFLNEALWQLGRLKESLVEQKANFTPASQAKVDQFANVTTDLDILSEIQYQLNQEFELKRAGHFYFYGNVKRIYKVNEGNKPFGRVAHTFLVQLCGEFRDRATMIEAKLKWITRLYTIPVQQVTTTIDFSKNIWSQMSAPDYYPYLNVTRALWEARMEAAPRYIQIGQYDTIDTPIEGPTVCETKYIFEKYVKKGKDFDDLDSYTQDYENNYRQLCSLADQKDYYDFRGDSNFKHYSPESNGMIWKATSMARACRSQWKAKSSVSGDKKCDGKNCFEDDDCRDYFRRPFYYRYNAARAALATGLVYNPNFDMTFDSQGDLPVTIHSHLQPHMAPMAFETETSQGEVFMFDPQWLAVQGWQDSDIGFNDYTG